MYISWSMHFDSQDTCGNCLFIYFFPLKGFEFTDCCLLGCLVSLTTWSTTLDNSISVLCLNYSQVNGVYRLDLMQSVVSILHIYERLCMLINLFLVHGWKLSLDNNSWVNNFMEALIVSSNHMNVLSAHCSMRLEINGASSLTWFVPVDFSPNRQTA